MADSQSLLQNNKDKDHGILACILLCASPRAMDCILMDASFVQLDASSYDYE